MTEPRPPDHALDEQEREIARILRALPAGEPSPALDASILRAAANAAAGSRRSRSRWLAPLGSFWGVGGAAAAVLALGVSWQMLDPSHRQAGETTSSASARKEGAADSAVMVEIGKSSRELPPAIEAPAPPPPAPALERRLPSPGASRSGPPVATASPPEAFPDAPMAAPAEAPASPPAPASAPAPALAQGVASDAAAPTQDFAESRESAAGKMAEQDSTAASAAVADAAQASASQKRAALAREAAPQTPAAWLARVRRLHAADRIEEARASLREFRKQYPEQVIPSDLAPLLRE